ncbi:DNA-directed RNA polymerase subunit alpha [Candidatus Cyrtobacter comes]|uniref:DNA-directed RNA polymerase subunit alpha n=1 Tax=Candidatus Cyrtobacter comes TaxID=675776 RepID=A0ABU5L7Z8_9RICK|nr:DNA-directed RNA polymerase subunit alpha [Candidatus Cyrtobacter comes]MDZ5762254.1 DNA-directed RNA polymerase subunit alpha [Candidatus Cyrtobacter comes]
MLEINEGTIDSIVPSVVVRSPSYYLDKMDGDSAVFKLEPLPSGLGYTIGNAMRRVMFSSLKGCAVTAIKFDSLAHEFSSIQGIKEDVTSMILNLKKVVVSSVHDEKKLKLECSNNTNEIVRVTAGMISCPAGVDVINKDFTICHIGPKAVLELEILVSSGFGYVSASSNVRLASNLGVGAIPLDATFCPVKRVSFSVDRSRIGADTEFDKLTLVVETNGSVQHDRVLDTAATVLRDHLSVFLLNLPLASIELSKEKSEADMPHVDVALLSKLCVKIDDLELSVRSNNCLKNANITYVGDIVIKDESKLLQTPNFGRKSLNEIKEVLSSMGLCLGMSLPCEWPLEDIEDMIKKYVNK